MKAVQWVRRVYGIPVPSPVAAGEVSVKDAARQLRCSPGVIYYWIETGQLKARRGTGNRLCIPWAPGIEAPLQLPDGTIAERTMGTPQGSAITPPTQ